MACALQVGDLALSVAFSCSFGQVYYARNLVDWLI